MQFASFLEEVWVSFLGRVILEVLVEGLESLELMLQWVLHGFGLGGKILGFHGCPQHDHCSPWQLHV